MSVPKITYHVGFDTVRKPVFQDVLQDQEPWADFNVIARGGQIGEEEFSDYILKCFGMEYADKNFQDEFFTHPSFDDAAIKELRKKTGIPGLVQFYRMAVQASLAAHRNSLGAPGSTVEDLNDSITADCEGSCARVQQVSWKDIFGQIQAYSGKTALGPTDYDKLGKVECRNCEYPAN